MDRYDLKYNSDGLMVVDNDLVWDKSDTQHVEDTLNAAPGWWKENFADGVNIRAYVNSSNQQQILQRIMKIQLESDLYTVTNPRVYFESDSKMIVVPNATI